jgi:hypothetical protein
VIHKGGWKDKFDISSVDVYGIEFSKEFLFSAKLAAVALTKVMQKDHARIMPITVMLWARVS